MLQTGNTEEKFTFSREGYNLELSANSDVAIFWLLNEYFVISNVNVYINYSRFCDFCFLFFYIHLNWTKGGNYPVKYSWVDNILYNLLNTKIIWKKNMRANINQVVVK